MAAGSRGNEESSDRRSAILDAAEQIMREEGYAAVSSRKVASRAGLKSQLVHYYFKTMDELFLSLFHRVDARFVDRLSDAIRSDNPLLALWQIQTHPERPRLTAEFIALAHHRPIVRDEIARAAERNRSIQVALAARILESRGIALSCCPPAALVLIMMGVAQIVFSETPLGIRTGHAEAFALIERCARALTSEHGVAELCAAMLGQPADTAPAGQG